MANPGVLRGCNYATLLHSVVWTANTVVGILAWIHPETDKRFNPLWQACAPWRVVTLINPPVERNDDGIVLYHGRGAPSFGYSPVQDSPATPLYRPHADARMSPVQARSSAALALLSNSWQKRLFQFIVLHTQSLCSNSIPHVQNQFHWEY